MPTTAFINSDVLLHTQQSEMRQSGLILSQGQICLNEVQTAGTLFGTGATDDNVVRLCSMHITGTEASVCKAFHAFSVLKMDQLPIFSAHVLYAKV